MTELVKTILKCSQITQEEQPKTTTAVAMLLCVS